MSNNQPGDIPSDVQGVCDGIRKSARYLDDLRDVMWKKQMADKNYSSQPKIDLLRVLATQLTQMADDIERAAIRESIDTHLMPHGRA